MCIASARSIVKAKGQDPESIKPIGWEIDIDVSIVFDDKETYSQVYNAITNPDGELRDEFNRVSEFLEELRKQKETKPRGFRKISHK